MRPTTKITERRCKGIKHSGEQCERTGSQFHDDNWYCTQHNPTRISHGSPPRDVRARACVAFFHGHPIPTERITEGGFWELTGKMTILMKNLALGPLDAAAMFGPDFDLQAHTDALAKDLYDYLAKLGVEP